MHSAILSLCAGTPTLGLAYEFKMEELFKNLVMSELVLSIQSVNANEVKASVCKLLTERNFYRKHIATATENMYKQAWLAESALPNVNCHMERAKINSEI
jgi:colanic acid/amylovoran biosynthesis protein